VRERILRLELPGGAHLTEADVAAELGVSRTPVREAFLRLEAEGFLALVRYRGAVVTTLTERDAREVMEVRALLERFAARRVLELGLDLAGRLDQVLVDQRAAAGDADLFIALDRRFHEVWIHGAGNEVVADLYATLRDRQQRLGMAAVLSQPGRVGEVLAEHQAIRDALVTGDPAAAEAAITAHLDITLAVLKTAPALHAPPVESGATP
jgi:DNA-binding GntR family transcriptional regulator